LQAPLGTAPVGQTSACGPLAVGRGSPAQVGVPSSWAPSVTSAVAETSQ
jgi:hypothetical protein